MQQYKSTNITEKNAPIYLAEYSLIDTNGEVVKEVSYVKRPRNKRGFVLMYTEKMVDFLSKVNQGSIVRVFLYIAQKQGYGTDGVFGFRTTRKHIAQFLGLTPRGVYKALDYLIENFLVNEIIIDGSREYMVNPDYITIGGDRKAREREWSTRWAFYWKYIANKSAAKKKS